MLSNLGTNSFKGILKDLVELIPSELRPSRSVTGHSGLRSMINTAVEAGVDNVVLSNVTQHRDVNTLRRYVDNSSSSSGVVSSAIGRSLGAVGEANANVDDASSADESYEIVRVTKKRKL
jgi:HEAT repeat protein